jgi:hypothetical protein
VINIKNAEEGSFFMVIIDPTIAQSRNWTISTVARWLLCFSADVENSANFDKYFDTVTISIQPKNIIQ